SRAILLHWNKAEISAKAAVLRKQAMTVQPLHAIVDADLAKMRKRPPDVFVIDLSRLPSHGYRVSFVLRQQKATRSVPIVFVDGEAKKVAGIREKLPDATYTSWSKIGPALKKALSTPAKNVVVPVSTSGYSGTPLPKKLGVDKGRSVYLVGAPADFERSIADGSSGQDIRRTGKAPADVVMLFARSKADFVKRLPSSKKLMNEGGGMWIAWPKKASGVSTDLTENVIREHGLAAGLVDYKVCAIDATWSGLKFARARKIG
ncbi:MAG TPA: DUF3052 family protein, partial [Phycisphaerae bacterium]|nr:DUF3052 family protein [Phycisphaerae bacterium]